MSRVPSDLPYVQSFEGPEKVLEVWFKVKRTGTGRDTPTSSDHPEKEKEKAPLDAHVDKEKGTREQLFDGRAIAFPHGKPDGLPIALPVKVFCCMPC